MFSSLVYAFHPRRLLPLLSLTCGPHPLASSLSSCRRARPRRHLHSSLSVVPATQRCCLRALTLPHHQDPSLTPLNPAPVINGVKAITSAITARCRLPTPIKGRARPWASLHHLPLSLSLELPQAPLCSRVKLEPPPLFASIVSSHRCRSCSSKPLTGFASSPSPSPTSAGEP
jgi:hypothetical protein